MQLVLAEIGSDSPMALQAVKQLALYLKDSAKRESVLEQVSNLRLALKYFARSIVANCRKMLSRPLLNFISLFFTGFCVADGYVMHK